MQISLGFFIGNSRLGKKAAVLEAFRGYLVCDYLLGKNLLFCSSIPEISLGTKVRWN